MTTSIRLDSYWRPYSSELDFAKKFRAEDKSSIEFLRVPKKIKDKMRNEQRWLYFYTKEEDKYHLPPSAWTCKYKIWDMKFWYKSDQLLDFQKDAMKNVFRDVLHRWKKGAYFISGTGTGKSHLIMATISMFRKPTIIIVPNSAIAIGLEEKISQYTKSVAIKKGKAILENDVEVAIVNHQTFNRYYNEINDSMFYKILLLDEAHHLPRKRIDQINLRKWERVLGYTATPQRKEFDIKWFEMVFWEVYNTKQTALPIEVRSYFCKIDYTAEEAELAMDWLSPDSPEFLRRLIIWNTNRYEKLLEVVKSVHKKWFKQIIIFSDRVNHIQATEEFLKKNLDVPVFTYYWSSNKEKIINDMKLEKEFILIGNTSCCWEWFDFPSLEVAIPFVSSSWENTIIQQAWRVNRFFWEKK